MIGSFVENEQLSSVDLPEDQRMRQGFLMKYNNGIIEYEKSWWMLDKEKEEKHRSELFTTIDEINKAKTISELKPLLIKLIQNN